MLLSDIGKRKGYKKNKFEVSFRRVVETGLRQLDGYAKKILQQ